MLQCFRGRILLPTFGGVRFSSSQIENVKKLELTLAILKPDLTQHKQHLNEVRQMIVDNDFLIVRSKIMKLNRSKAEEFYEEHRGKFFYNRLVTYMSSGPIHPLILAKENAIQDWRKLMGPTKVFKTRFSDPETIRGKFGLTDTRNATHGSDSIETADKETKFFYPEFCRQQFFDEEETFFRSGNIELDLDNFVHKIRR
eukprot:TRINITY_DN6325_c0_g1_i8.p1 TRINITY_DN6325_c0_g1~~TRINITY_DN6325_c0_g1_i8.p1  ORF type:complete len:211 (+),score=11.63 TRINITY_DN6325_c0_g1_i8:39-635(+)